MTKPIRTQRSRDHRRAAKLRRYSKAQYQKAREAAEQSVMDGLFRGWEMMQSKPNWLSQSEIRPTVVSGMPVREMDLREGYLRQALAPELITKYSLNHLRDRAVEEMVKFMVREGMIEYTQSIGRGGVVLFEWRMFVGRPVKPRMVVHAPIPDKEMWP